LIIEPAALREKTYFSCDSGLASRRNRYKNPKTAEPLWFVVERYYHFYLTKNDQTSIFRANFYTKKLCVEALPEASQNDGWNLNTLVMRSSNIVTKTVKTWNYQLLDN
jgi:hypothetical protein